MILRAKYVVPVDAPTIKNGAVRFAGARIAEVGSARTVSGGPVVDYGDAVLLPGFVNAHTHLELSHLADRVPPSADFIDWLERLRATVQADGRSLDTFAESARAGAAASLAAGVTTVGDITARPRTVRASLRHGPLRVVSFGEVIAAGQIRGLLSERLLAAIDGREASAHLSVALSPHAPYTVEAEGLAACVEAAERLELRLCMHVAETRAEVRYTEHGDGPFRDLMTRMALHDDGIVCPRMTPIFWVQSLGLLSPRTLLAHVNYPSAEEINVLAACGVHVAYCPRTHQAFGHEAHPFRALLAAGVNVCVGTDSLASNPSLSVLEEVRFLSATHGETDSTLWVEMATQRGARALGLEHQIGSLTPGKSADLVAVPLEASGPADPVKNALRSRTQPIATFVRGRQVYPRVVTA